MQARCDTGPMICSRWMEAGLGHFGVLEMDVSSRFLALGADVQSRGAGFLTLTNSEGSNFPPCVQVDILDSENLGSWGHERVDGKAWLVFSVVWTGKRIDICCTPQTRRLLWWDPLVSSQNRLPTYQTSIFNKALNREVTTFVQNSRRHPLKQKKDLYV